MADIEATIGELGAKAKAGKITMDDMAGGTFSITNGGVFGSLISTPILNLPQSAILGMHGDTSSPLIPGVSKLYCSPVVLLCIQAFSSDPLSLMARWRFAP